MELSVPNDFIGDKSLGILSPSFIVNNYCFTDSFSEESPFPLNLSDDFNLNKAFIEDQNISPINKSNLSILNQGFLLSDNTRSKVSTCDSNSLTIDDRRRENDDLVFKDGEKIVNNSIVNDADENVFLACTPQPAETVFKTIDKLFPRSISILNTQDKSVPNNTTSRLGNSQDISMPDSLTSENVQAQIAFNKLSVILFNSTNISEQQKIEGKKLLLNLAAIFNASTSMQLNVDSELSSIPENLTNHESNQKENRTIQKCLTPSLKLPNKVKEVQMKIMKYSEACTGSFNNINKSNDMPTKGSFKIKARSLKPPKRKASLIAKIPVDAMMKSTSDLFNEYKTKKGIICSVWTSTPKNDLKMHPNATSAPDPKIGITLQPKPLGDSFHYNKIKSYERERINSISKSTGKMAVLPIKRGNLLQKTVKPLKNKENVQP